MNDKAKKQALIIIKMGKPSAKRLKEMKKGTACKDK